MNAENPDSQPTPEFMERCLPIIKAWEAGTLPFNEAAERFAALRAEAESGQRPANHGMIEIMMGVMYGYRASFDAAIDHFRKARRLFEQAGNQERMLLCDTNIAECYRDKGEISRARQMFGLALQTARQQGNRRIEIICIVNEGQIQLRLGFPNIARSALEQAVQRIAESGDVRPQVIGLLCEAHRDLASIYLLQGEAALAWNAAKSALLVAQESGEVLRIGFANRALGEVLTALDAPPDAEEGFSDDPDHYFQMAMNQFREIKAEGEVARTLSVHAESLAKRGQVMTGAKKMQQAVLLFSRLGMVAEAARAAEMQMQMLKNAQG